MPVAARLTDPIQHSNALTGLLIGAAAGLAFGVFVVATGGAGLVVGAAIIGGSVCAGAGIGELVGSLDLTNSLVGGTVTGAIASGSGNTLVNSLAAARATDDIVQCAGTPPLYLPSHPQKRIAQGSGSVFINSQPAARISDKIECGAQIQMGSPNVVFGGPTVTTLAIDSEIPGWIQGTLFVIGLASAVVLVGPIAAGLGLLGGVAGGIGGSWLGGKIFGEGSDGQKIMGFLGSMAGGALGTKMGMSGKLGSWNQAGKCKLGLEPIDLGSGAVVDHAVDLALPGAIALSWERRYHSAGSGRTGALGRGGWTHSLDQWVSRDVGQTTLRDEEGRDVYFPALAIGQKVLHRSDRVELTALEGGVFEAYHLGTRLTRTFAPLDARYEHGEGRGDERSVLRQIRDAWGNVMTLDYERGRLEAITDTAGRRLRVTTGREGRVTRVEVWAEGALQTWVSYGYAETGELDRVTDALGYEERYAYDGARRMVQKTLKNGVSFFYEYDDRTGACKRSYGDGGLHAGDIAFDVERRITYLTGNDEPRVLRFNEDGLLIREETPDGALLGTWEYDKDLYLVAEVNGAGEARRYTYDARGNKTSETDPAGNVTRWEHKDDLPSSKRAASGRVTTYRYDDRGGLIEVISPDGATHGFARDARGHLVMFADVDGPIHRYEHSARHDLTAETLEGGERITYEHDALGRVTAYNDPSGGRTVITYDRRGRPLSMVRPDGTTTRNAYGPYDDIIPARADALGQIARSEHVGLGSLSKLTDVRGAVWELSYTKGARLQTVKNPKGEEHTFVYDTAGRVVEERAFDGRALQYRYDTAGRLAEIVHPDGGVRRLSYDTLGNVTRDEAPGSVITYQRGPTGHAWRVTLEDEDGAMIVTDIARDPSGRVVRERTGDHEVQSTYDDRDRRVTRTLHDGTVTTYAYERGDLTRIAHGAHHVTFAQGAGANEVSWTSGRAKLEGRFDAMGRLVGQDVSAGRPLLSKRYRYDDNGRLTRVEDDRWGATEYTYDPLGHLRAASRRRWREELEYDGAGAILRMIGGLSPAASTWDLGPGGAVERAGGVTFEYDMRGRRVRRSDASGAEVRYRWDGRDRLREVSRSNGERVLMTYDAFGRRIRKEVRAPSGEVRVTEIVWDGAALAADITPDRGTRTFVHWPGTLTPLLHTEAGETLTYVNDPMGMPKDLLSSSGEVVWSAAHSAWGAVTEARQTPLNGRDVATPIRMLGHYMDDETGLACSLFRYLDPSIGGWCSRDPLGVVGGANPFAWGRSPTNVVDPFGLSNYYFRGDDGYRGGPIGYPIGSDAAAGAEVQTPWEHVNGKQGDMTSRYTSFAEDLKSTSKFGDRAVKVKIDDLQALQEQGQVRVLKPEDVRAMMEAEGISSKKINGVMQQMKTNKEVLVEGEIPESLIKGCK